MVIRRIRDISPGQKWWQTVLRIGFSCSQWDGSTCTLEGSYFFPLGERRGRRGRGPFFGILVFPPCPQSVPYRFPKPFFFPFGGEKGEGCFFGDFGVPTMSPICSPKVFPTFSLLDVFPQDVPNSTKLYPQFLHKVEISLSWAKGKHLYTSILRSAQCFQEKVMGQSKWLIAKKTIQKRLCVQAAPSN